MKTLKKPAKMIKKQMFNKTRKKLALYITHGKMKKMSDRLDILKNKCEQEIHEVEEKLRVLKAKLANLISLAQESEKLANPESEPDKYADTGLTAAVLSAVQELWAARKMGSPIGDVKNYLLAHGFKAGENFDTAIYTVVGRLVGSGQVIRELGNVEYWGGPLGTSRRIIPRGVYRPKQFSGTGAGVGNASH